MTELADKIEAAHTPGPWEVRPCLLTKNLDICLPVKSGKAAVISTAWGNEADAHLIAAAPELLEAAERILERGYVSQSIEEERDDHDALKAAIAKARGQAALRAGDTDGKR